MTEDEIKEKIVNRLHDKCGIRTIGLNTELPKKINVDDILWAINLGEYFYKEDRTKPPKSCNC
jgi:hypothetical protein